MNPLVDTQQGSLSVSFSLSSHLSIPKSPKEEYILPSSSQAPLTLHIYSIYFNCDGVCGRANLYLKLHELFSMDCFSLGTFRIFMETAMVDQAWPAAPGFRSQARLRKLTLFEQGDASPNAEICSCVTLFTTVLSLSLERTSMTI